MYDFLEDDEYQQRPLVTYHYPDLFDIDSPELDIYDDKRTDLMDSVQKEIDRIEFRIVSSKQNYQDASCNIDRLEDELDLLKMELNALEVHFIKEDKCA